MTNAFVNLVGFVGNKKGLGALVSKAYIIVFVGSERKDDHANS